MLATMRLLVGVLIIFGTVTEGNVLNDIRRARKRVAGAALSRGVKQLTNSNNDDTSQSECVRERCPTPRVRKPWSKLNCKERDFYIKAVKTAKETRTSEYDNFVQVHRNNYDHAHGTSVFLPWHRWYLVSYENMLRSHPDFECVTVPYWDSENDATDREMSSVLRSQTFGSTTGTNTIGCVTEGVAAGWRDNTTIEKQCLKRTFGFGEFHDSEQLTDLIVGETSYETFSKSYESWHFRQHTYVGGQMLGPSSPADPLFWVHHSSVDRIWAIWQNYHGYHLQRYDQIDSDHYQPRPSRLEFALDSEMKYYDRLPGESYWLSQPVKVRDVMNTLNMPHGVGVLYEDGVVSKLLTEPLSGGDWKFIRSVTRSLVVCCGDGTVDDGESCDDGNLVAGDGCTDCRIDDTPFDAPIDYNQPADSVSSPIDDQSEQ